MARQEDSPVMLSAVKHLDAHRERPFAALRVTRMRLSVSHSRQPYLARWRKYHLGAFLHIRCSGHKARLFYRP